MSRFLARQMAASHYFDISAARRDFDYNPKVSMAEGMRRLAAGIKGTGAYIGGFWVSRKYYD